MGVPFTITINSINNGQQTQEDFPIEGGFNSSIAIDPDVPANLDESVSLSSGLITPVTFALDSGFAGQSALHPIINMFMPGINDSSIYILDRDGEVFTAQVIADGFTTFSNPANFAGAPTGGVYYKDYIYAFGTTSNSDDVGRYGPLTGTPTEDNNYWTSEGLTELQTGYRLPEIDNIEYPIHWAYVHVDDTIYFADYVNDQGVVHRLRTDASGNNTGSAYNVLDLPSGYKITCFTSWGNDLVIGAMRWGNAGNITASFPEPALFFWDTISDSFYNVVEIKEWSLLTALINKGGTIYALGGTLDEGHSIGVYDGSQGVSQLAFLPYGQPPFPGAVSIYGDRVVWGSRAPFVANNDKGVVYALGSKDPRISTRAIQCIAKSAIDTDDVLITSLIYPFQDSGVFPKLLIGTYSANNPAGNDAAIEKADSTATQDSTIEFGQFNIGEPFRIDKIRVPLGASVTNGVTITPSLLFDDRQDTYTLPTINNTNYSGRRNIVYKKPQLTNQSSGVENKGEHNFLLKFDFTGTVPTSIKFPITIEGTTLDD